MLQSFRLIIFLTISSKSFLAACNCLSYISRCSYTTIIIETIGIVNHKEQQNFRLLPDRSRCPLYPALRGCRCHGARISGISPLQTLPLRHESRREAYFKNKPLRRTNYPISSNLLIINNCNFIHNHFAYRWCRFEIIENGIHRDCTLCSFKSPLRGWLT